MKKAFVGFGGMAALAIIASPITVEGQRSATNLREELASPKISCRVKLYAKGAGGTDEQIPNFGSAVVAGGPPRVYGLVFLNNEGPVSGTVQTKLRLDKDSVALSSGVTAVQPPFVNRDGYPLPTAALLVTTTVAAHGAQVLGPFWLKNSYATTLFFFTALSNVEQGIGCQHRFTMIPSPR